MDSLTRRARRGSPGAGSRAKDFFGYDIFCKSHTIELTLYLFFASVIEI
jgi:hypothetical protein